MTSVRVAIVGVGNCAASLVQGVQYYRDADPTEQVPGLMHVQFGDYHVRDVEFVAAFDVDAKKVGRDLSEAIVASENNTIKICRRAAAGRDRAARAHPRRARQVLPRDHHRVRRGAGRRGRHAARGPGRRAGLLPAGRLRGRGPVLRPVRASTPEVAFVNALPVFIAGTPEWAEKFTDAGVPIIGDDIKSQVGATITHRVLAKLFEDRGVVARPHLCSSTSAATWTS